MIIKV